MAYNNFQDTKHKVRKEWLDSHTTSRNIDVELDNSITIRNSFVFNSANNIIKKQINLSTDWFSFGASDPITNTPIGIDDTNMALFKKLSMPISNIPIKWIPYIKSNLIYECTLDLITPPFINKTPVLTNIISDILVNIILYHWIIIWYTEDNEGNMVAPEIRCKLLITLTNPELYI